MNNFPITVESGELAGQTFWISRAIAVVGGIFATIRGKICVLANKRGKGTPDFQGYWNMPCGYLDFNETSEDAVIREVYEETGVKVSPEQLHFWKFDDSPNSNRQNVTFEYYAVLNNIQPGTISVNANNSRGGEDNEVDAVQWIPVDDIDNYKWAFNHNTLIKELIIVAECSIL